MLLNIVIAFVLTTGVCILAAKAPQALGFKPGVSSFGITGIPWLILWFPV
jgi:hypothetical protein